MSRIYFKETTRRMRGVIDSLPPSARPDAESRRARHEAIETAYALKQLVTAGVRVFGYDNIDVADADGKRSHVERQVNEAESAIVRRIFDLCAAGTGYTRIAKPLNVERAPAPRPQ